MTKAQFNRQEVLNNAIDLFWQKGYSAASMKDVVSATGLKPGSIYLAFESKEGLFRESLEVYAKQMMANMVHVLEASNSVGEGLITILQSMLKEAEAEQYCSCFLIKTQLELKAQGGDLYHFASEQLQKVEATFRTYLEKEFSQDESRQRATSIMLHIFGMRIYSYQEGSSDRIMAGLQNGLPWLPWK